MTPPSKNVTSVGPVLIIVLTFRIGAARESLSSRLKAVEDDPPRRRSAITGSFHDPPEGGAQR